MEFKEFCKELDRMCSAEQSKCKIRSKVMNCMNCDSYCFANSDEAEKIVSEWAKEHPIVTNRKKFKEVFGFNIMVKPENEGDFLIKKDELLDRIDEWLKQEYQPPRKESADES